MFLHSLVKATTHRGHGWIAPAELSEDLPSYVSFVLPLDSRNHLATQYVCEVARLGSSKLIRERLNRVGQSEFRLKVASEQIWFHVQPGPSKERRLPYIGSLEHPDFQHSLTEIEPDDQAQLDSICASKGLFVVGCDPFIHYDRIGTRRAAPSLKPSEERQILWVFAHEDAVYASRLLNFMCLNQFEHVWISVKDFHQLRRTFEKNPATFYSWSVNSPSVQLISRKLEIDAARLKQLMREGAFSIESRYTPSRRQRDEWINEKWKRVPLLTASREGFSNSSR